MSPVAFHAPPAVDEAPEIVSAANPVIVLAAAPCRSTIFSIPNAKNPMRRLSGDQNGCSACSVPGSSRPAASPTGRSSNWYSPVPPRGLERATIYRPSGDTAK